MDMCSMYLIYPFCLHAYNFSTNFRIPAVFLHAYFGIRTTVFHSIHFFHNLKRNVTKYLESNEIGICYNNNIKTDYY